LYSGNNVTAEILAQDHSSDRINIWYENNHFQAIVPNNHR